MPAPAGTLVDLNSIEAQIDMLKLFLQRNAMAAAKTQATQILSQFTTLNTAIQAASANTELSASPTLALRRMYTTDPGIALSDGDAGPNTTTITNA